MNRLEWYSQIYNRFLTGPIPNPWILPNVDIRIEYASTVHQVGFSWPTIDRVPAIAACLARLGVHWDWQHAIRSDGNMGDSRVVIQQLNTVMIKQRGHNYDVFYTGLPPYRGRFCELQVFPDSQSMWVDLEILNKIFGLRL